MEAVQGFFQVTASVVFGSDTWFQRRILDNARVTGLLPSWCRAGAVVCRKELAELVDTTGRSGESWLATVDTGSGPMAFAQLLACALDAPASDLLMSAIRQDTELLCEVVVALAELSVALARRLATTSHLPVDEILQRVEHGLSRDGGTENGHS